jgi:hypothetical protein
LKRAIFIPASISAHSPSTDQQAGPRVQIIFVFLISVCVNESIDLIINRAKIYNLFVLEVAHVTFEAFNICKPERKIEVPVHLQMQTDVKVRLRSSYVLPCEETESCLELYLQTTWLLQRDFKLATRKALQSFPVLGPSGVDPTIKTGE